MVSEKVQLDFGTDYFDDSNYKSCFARSVAVNSQFKQTHDQCQNSHQHETVEGAAEYSSKKSECTSASAFQKPDISNDIVFERKVCFGDDQLFKYLFFIDCKK